MMSTLLKLAVVVMFVGVSWRWYENSQRLPPVVDGFYQPEYQPVADLFRQFVEDGTERGGMFAVYQGGKPLIEVWGGYADPDSRRLWGKDTLTVVFSAVKGVSAIAVAKLVEKGLLDYKKEVHEYWPEFAVNGKSNITVEMLLSHQGGLDTLGGASFSILDYKYSWDKVEKLLASATPNYPPGSKLAYHVCTFGMYVDALIRHVDPRHRNLSQFFDEEIAKPYDIDFYIGLPKSQYYRAARVFEPSALQTMLLFFDAKSRPYVQDMFSSDSVLMRGIRVLQDLDISIYNDPDRLEVGIGSNMGLGNARSLAKLYDYLASGIEVGGKPLLPSKIVEKFDVSLTDSLPNLVAGVGSRSMSVGFMVDKDAEGTRFGHAGYGGQQARADPRNKLGIAYVTNFNWPHIPDPPPNYQQLEALFYECYKRQKAKSQGR